MGSQHVVTRFPPSPTGELHIGGARTALFNWLFARKAGGKFILRIEDTDRHRSTPEATQAILESMRWLGLDWDEGPYFQSQRFHLYDAFIERLLSSGKAYYCHCSPEVLERKREEARARGLKPKYDGTCRDRNLGPAPGAVVRLKASQTGTTQFHDLIKGTIRISNEELDDLVLKRSDGSPTYHMAVVCDDITLGITHVIRGDDHVNNTPRQIQIYEALEQPLPAYAHVPMILGPDRKRLSKRHGAMSVLAYRDMGYLPQALLNALVRLGWSYGDQEKFTLEEMIEKFSLEGVGRSAGIFNAEKLLDLNAWYIRETPDRDLANALLPFMEAEGFGSLDVEKLTLAVGTLKKRSKTLVEMAAKARVYFLKELPYDPKAEEKYLRPEMAPLLSNLYQRLEGLFPFDQPQLERAFLDFLDAHQITMKVAAQPVRVALTGQTVSPGLFEMMEVLGKEEVLRRLRLALERIQHRPQTT